jgi:hypothetical protein
VILRRAKACEQDPGILVVAAMQRLQWAVATPG